MRCVLACACAARTIFFFLCEVVHLIEMLERSNPADQRQLTFFLFLKAGKKRRIKWGSDDPAAKRCNTSDCI